MTDMKRDLRAFMRESAKTEEVVTVPGPETIKDENGETAMLEIRVLSAATIQKITDNYKKRRVATDKKGQPYIQNGEVVFQTEKDNVRASQHLLVEALVYPDLKNPDLMAFYECHDITEMPMKVFPRSDEYAHVNRAVMLALGIVDGPTQEEKDEAFEAAKN
jgi:hypothetical protein